MPLLKVIKVISISVPKLPTTQPTTQQHTPKMKIKQE